MKRGKFIVIDGTDGSGKATQTKMLVERLSKDKIKVKKIDFPRYYNNFFGELIGEALAGKYGDFIAINPHIASVLYAADRWESSKQIETWLKSGYTVVADRYVSANQIHQGGKIADENERFQFLTWLDKMEHGIFKIPRPDAVIFLNMPVQLSLGLLQAKSLENKKRYLKSSKDLAESNAGHLLDSQTSAISIVRKNNKWYQVECGRGEEILTREEIHNEVYKIVEKNLLSKKVSKAKKRR
jgi:dTMP kinase